METCVKKRRGTKLTGGRANRPSSIFDRAQLRDQIEPLDTIASPIFFWSLGKSGRVRAFRTELGGGLWGPNPTQKLEKTQPTFAIAL